MYCRLPIKLFLLGFVAQERSEKNKFSKLCIICLRSNRVGGFQFKQTFEFSGAYDGIRPAKLTNHGACTGLEIYP